MLWQAAAAAIGDHARSLAVLADDLHNVGARHARKLRRGRERVELGATKLSSDVCLVDRVLTRDGGGCSRGMFATGVSFEHSILQHKLAPPSQARALSKLRAVTYESSKAPCSPAHRGGAPNKHS